MIGECFVDLKKEDEGFKRGVSLMQKEPCGGDCKDWFSLWHEQEEVIGEKGII